MISQKTPIFYADFEIVEKNAEKLQAKKCQIWSLPLSLFVVLKICEWSVKLFSMFICFQLFQRNLKRRKVLRFLDIHATK